MQNKSQLYAKSFANLYVINTDARIQAGFTQHELDWIYEVEQTLKSYIKK